MWLLSLALLFNISCGNEWLEIRSDKKIVIPSTLEDAAALLANNAVMNISSPVLGEISSDDYEATDAQFFSVPAWEANAYSWAEKIFVDNNGATNWHSVYQRIYNANLAIQTAENVSDNMNLSEKNRILAKAKFFRAYSYFELAQIFCEPYAVESSTRALGLPLVKKPDLEQKLARSNVEETYQFILDDLAFATSFLPESVAYKVEPSRAAAMGMCARVYLIMGNYEKALLYADSCLAYGQELMDFRELDATPNYPIAAFNPEVLFDCAMLYSTIALGSRLNVSSEIVESYEPNDLRKTVLLRENEGLYNFRGSYNGTNIHFTGIAVNEILLIKAECLARLDKVTDGQEALNYLLEYRVEGHKNLIFSSQYDLLRRVLQERRKELLFRGLRWMDLRRLNKSPEIAKDLVRIIDGKQYVLKANSKRYVFPIPDLAVELGGYEQNER